MPDHTTLLLAVISRLYSFNRLMHRPVLLVPWYLLNHPSINRFKYGKVLDDIQEVLPGEQPRNQQLLRVWILAQIRLLNRVWILPFQVVLHAGCDRAYTSTIPMGGYHHLVVIK